MGPRHPGPDHRDRSTPPRRFASIVLALAAMLASGCNTGSDPASAPSHRQGTGPLPRPDIGAAAALILQHAGPHRLVLLGEKHGTVEAPQLALQLLQHWSTQGTAWLAMEAWQADQPLLDAYLQSGCADAQRLALRAGAFWTIDHDRHDGRRNAAALELVDAVCQLRSAGNDVRILAFDPGPAGGDNHARSRQMADTLRQQFASLPANGRLLVIAGNVHAMRARPRNAPVQMQIPMGQHLLDLQPYSIDLLARSGAFQGCLPAGCGPMPVQLPPTIRSGPVNGPYHLRIVLDRFTVAALLGSKP